LGVVEQIVFHPFKKWRNSRAQFYVTDSTEVEVFEQNPSESGNYQKDVSLFEQ
jgi:hypothetical protein